MKLTKSILKEMVKQELKEFTSTGGGTAALQRQKAATKGVSDAKADKKTKSNAWGTAKATYKTKSKAATTATSTYNTKNSALTTISGQKYRKASGRGYLYSATAAKGYSLNPTWTLKNNARTTALNSKNTADTEKTSAETDRDTKERDYNKAVSGLSDSEKSEKAIKADTNFAASGGGGGRASGKGGTAKKGKGKGKDESIFRILGRDLIKELKDIKKYS